MQIIIRQCRPDDVARLEMVLPAELPGLHRERLMAQERGDMAYLLACLDDRPVAHLQMLWSGSVHPAVRRLLPDAVEIRRFLVEENLRGEGIGSRLLTEAEALAATRGCKTAGLAVGAGNEAALRLYRRRGYCDWGGGTFESRWTRMAGDGELEEHRHMVRYLVKELTAERLSVA